MTANRPIPTTLLHSHKRLSSQSKPGLTQAFLFEVLREMAFENCLEIAGHSLRVGLAVSQWQMEQACIFLNHLNKPPLPSPEPSHERIVAMALHAGLTPQCDARANAVVVLRRDGPQGLALDHAHHEAIGRFRDKGGVLAEIEQSAFASQIPLDPLLDPMIRALSAAVSEWGTTEIVAECPRRQYPFYYSRLGFHRVSNCPSSKNDRILIHLPASRLASLHA